MSCRAVLGVWISGKCQFPPTFSVLRVGVEWTRGCARASLLLSKIEVQAKDRQASGKM